VIVINCQSADSESVVFGPESAGVELRHYFLALLGLFFSLFAIVHLVLQELQLKVLGLLCK